MDTGKSKTKISKSSVKSKTIKKVNVVIEEDNEVNTKQNKQKKVKNPDIEKLAEIVSKLEQTNSRDNIPGYNSSCVEIYKLYIKLELSFPKLLTQVLKKRILDVIKKNIKDDTSIQPYSYLCENMNLLSDHTKLLMEFDTLFFKYHSIFSSYVLNDLRLYSIPSQLPYGTSKGKCKNLPIPYKHRYYYIQKVILNNSDVPYTYYSQDSLLHYKTIQISSPHYKDIVYCLDIPYVNIDLVKVFELCSNNCLLNLIHHLETVTNSKYYDTIFALMDSHLKKKYEENKCELLNLHWDEYYCKSLPKISFSSQILNILIKYTDCNDIVQLFNCDNIDIFVNIMQTSQHYIQRKNVLRELFKNIYQNCNKKEVYRSSYLHSRIKFESLECIINSIKKHSSKQYKLFNAIFDVVSPSVEYMNMFINFNNKNYTFLGFYLMLNRGIMPTFETLELACENFPYNDICMIIENKLLPTQECFEEYIFQNKNVHVTAHASTDETDEGLKMFMGYGLRISESIIENCIKRSIRINFKEYDIDYTLKMYNMYLTHNKIIPDSVMRQFLSNSEIKNIISFKEALKKSSWKNVGKIGLEHKIIPDQQCFDLACESRHEEISIGLLRGAKIIQIPETNYVLRYEPDEAKKYVKFLLDQTKIDTFTITKQNVERLCRNNRTDCLGYLVSATYVNDKKIYDEESHEE